MFARSTLAALAIAAALAAAPAAFAQPAPGAPAVGAPSGTAPEHHRKHGSADMRALQSLSLNATQKQQIADLVRADRAAGRPADRAAWKARHLALRGKIEGLLTPEQRTAFEANLKAHRPAKTAS